MQQQANIPIFTANTGVLPPGTWSPSRWMAWTRLAETRTVRRDHDRRFTTSFLILSQLVSAANLDTVQPVVVFHKRVGWCTNTQIHTDTSNTHRYRIDFELCITFLAVSLICEWSIQRIFFWFGILLYFAGIVWAGETLNLILSFCVGIQDGPPQL